MTGAKYSNRLPPLSQPLPHSSASPMCVDGGASATRNVGGASFRHRGFGSPMASTKRLTCPASTVMVTGAPSTPTRVLSRSITYVIVALTSSTTRQTQNALRDDVALDLGRPGVDGLRLRPHPAVLPAA